MGSCKYTDDAFTTIASNVAAIDTSIVVASNTRFSGLISGGTDHFFVTIVKSTSGAKETVKVTAAASTTWTVVRAQGPGDTALTFVVGDLVSMRVGKNLLDAFPQDDDLSGTGGAALIGKSGTGTVQDHITTITGTGGAAAVGKSGSGTVQDHITTITGTGGAAAVGMSTGSNVQTTMNAMPYDMTLAEFMANTPPLKAGDVVTISDRAGATFDIASGVSGANTYNVIANTAGTLKAVLREEYPYNIMAFGPDNTGATDETARLQVAHDLGYVWYYPDGRYLFSTLEMDTGGIVGQSKATILLTNDTTTGDVITHNVKDPDSLLINERGAMFDKFTLRASTNGIDQKASGAGIRIVATTPENENYTSTVHNVTIRNIPTSLSTSLTSFVSIKDNYFAFYKTAGVYMDMDHASYNDNGDNVIADNSFYTTNTSAKGIRYRCGGGRIKNNKINGGAYGVDITPLRSSSVMLVSGNSIENQNTNQIRYVTEGDTLAVDFGRIVISDNQLNGASNTGPSIAVTSTAFTSREWTITGNQIQHNAATAAIDVNNIERFYIGDNEIYGNNVSTSGIRVRSATGEGHVGPNAIYGINGRNVLNESAGTVTCDQVIGSLSGTIALPSLATGAYYSETYAISQAALGDEVIVTFPNTSTVGLLVTAQVYASGAVNVEVKNNTGGTINLGTINIKLRVKAI